MKKLPIGIQLYNLRELLDDHPENFEKIMRKIKELGFDGVEFAGLYGIDPKEIKRVLDEVGLVPVSAHVPFDEMEADMEKVVNDYKTIGVKYIAVPYLPEELRPGTDKYEYVLDSIRKFAQYAKEHGLQMLYHNHDFEFTKLPDGEYAFDHMYKVIPADLLKVQPDTCWIKVAGEDPAAYIKKYADRCPVVHLKDFFKEGAASNMYQLLGAENKDTETKGIFEFRPLGEGLQNWKEILDAVDDSCAEWIIYEQDMDNGVGPIEVAKSSREYLKKIYG